MGFGSNSSDQSSKPLSAAERSDIFGSGMTNIAGSLPDRYKTYLGKEPVYATGPFGNYKIGERDKWGLNLPEYAASADPGEARTMSGGDYDRLERNIITSRTAPLDEAWRKSRESINQDASDRGLWASGVPVKNEQDYFAREFLPAYQQAGAEAATQRYGLQSGENQMLNQYALNRAGFNAGEESKEYESKWRLPDYLQGLYNQTGGTISSGKGGGFNFTI